jgi:uncharacterized protein (DUF2141 family)
MVFKKIFLVLFLLLFFSLCIFANEHSIIVEITGVTINGGNVFVSVYSNESDYKRDIPFIKFILESQNTIVSREVTLPEGEYLIAAFQDTNNNGRLDTNIFNVPREPAGLTNYTGGIPRGFHRHKVPVNENTLKITVHLHNL